MFYCDAIFLFLKHSCMRYPGPWRSPAASALHRLYPDQTVGLPSSLAPPPGLGSSTRLTGAGLYPLTISSLLFVVSSLARYSAVFALHTTRYPLALFFRFNHSVSCCCNSLSTIALRTPASTVLPLGYGYKFFYLSYQTSADRNATPSSGVSA